MNSETKLPITVVILTKNEEETIHGAIASAISDYVEVIVLDSFSTDATESVANAAGARVIKNEFRGYASQRNFALHELQKKSDWVFFLDADERITQELTAELRREFAGFDAAGVGMIYMRRKDFFEGRWIKRSSGYPTWFGRLCHAPSVSVRREINEEYVCSRDTLKVQAHLVHYPFAKGVEHWVYRHNNYSSAEAAKKIEGEAVDLRLLWRRDAGMRRKGLKQIYMKIPFRPLAGFLFLYVAKGGFLDGRPGFRYALLRAFYEFLISIKVGEMRRDTYQAEKSHRS